MTRDRLPALRAVLVLKRRSTFFDFDNLPEQGAYVPLNSEYKLFVESEYLYEFLAEARNVWQDLRWLKEKVEEVKKKQSFILSEPKTNEDAKRELDDLIACIKKMAYRIKEKLQEFEVEEERAKKENPTSAKPRIYQMQYESLSRCYIEIMLECNAAQVDHRERCKERLKRQLEIARRAPTNEDQLEEILEKGSLFIFQEIDCSDAAEARIILAEIEARHQAILKLEQSILELHSMFMDMAILIESQGEMVNQIYYNVMHAVDFVGTGTKFLKKALKLQSRFRWNRIIIITVVAVILIIIIGSVVGSMKK